MGWGKSLVNPLVFTYWQVTDSMWADPRNRTWLMANPHATCQLWNRYMLVSRDAMFIDHNRPAYWAPFSTEENPEPPEQPHQQPQASTSPRETSWPGGMRPARPGWELRLAYVRVAVLPSNTQDIIEILFTWRSSILNPLFPIYRRENQGLEVICPRWRGTDGLETDSNTSDP